MERIRWLATSVEMDERMFRHAVFAAASYSGEGPWIQYDPKTRTCMKTAPGGDRLMLHLDVERRFDIADYAELDLATNLGGPIRSAIHVQYVPAAPPPPGAGVPDLIFFVIGCLRLMDQELNWPTALVVRREDGTKVATRGADT